MNSKKDSILNTSNVQIFDMDGMEFPHEELKQLLNFRSKQHTRSISLIGPQQNQGDQQSLSSAMDPPVYKEILNNWCKDIDHSKVDESNGQMTSKREQLSQLQSQSDIINLDVQVIPLDQTESNNSTHRVVQPQKKNPFQRRRSTQEVFQHDANKSQELTDLAEYAGLSTSLRIDNCMSYKKASIAMENGQSPGISNVFQRMVSQYVPNSTQPEQPQKNDTQPMSPDKKFLFANQEETSENESQEKNFISSRQDLQSSNQHTQPTTTEQHRRTRTTRTTRIKKQDYQSNTSIAVYENTRKQQPTNKEEKKSFNNNNESQGTINQQEKLFSNMNDSIWSNSSPRNDLLQTKLKDAEDQSMKYQSMRKRIKELTDEKIQYFQTNMSLKNEVDFLQNQNGTLQSQIDVMGGNMEHLQLQLQDKDSQIQQLESENETLCNDINLLKKGKNLETDAIEAFSKISQDLLLAQSKIQQLSQVGSSISKTKSKKQENARINKELEMAQFKIQELNQYIAEIKKPYIARKNDTIDQLLANYIKKLSDQDKLRILFVRVSLGVYMFGKRRVCVSVDRVNQLKVKHNGKAYPIDDFIADFSGQEVKQIKRRNAVARFQQNWYNYNTIEQVNKTAFRQHSPQRQRSPVRHVSQSFVERLSPQFRKPSISPTRSPGRELFSPKQLRTNFFLN